MKATLFKTDGSAMDVVPANGKFFEYEELKKFVGGIVEIVPLPGDKSQMVCNEEGKLIGLPVNEKATALWKKFYPIELYPNNNDELVVGDVLFCDTEILECQHLCTETNSSGTPDDPHWETTCCDCGELVDED